MPQSFYFLNLFSILLFFTRFYSFIFSYFFVDGELPGLLHEVHMPIITNKECEAMYFQAGYPETIRDVFVCAGVVNGGLDACEVWIKINYHIKF